MQAGTSILPYALIIVPVSLCHEYYLSKKNGVFMNLYSSIIKADLRPIFDNNRIRIKVDRIEIV